MRRSGIETYRRVFANPLSFAIDSSLPEPLLPTKPGVFYETCGEPSLGDTPATGAIPRRADSNRKRALEDMDSDPSAKRFCAPTAERQCETVTKEEPAPRPAAETPESALFHKSEVPKIPAAVQRMQDKARECFLRDNFNEALEVLTTAVSEFPCAILLAERATVLLQLRRLEECIRDCETARTMDPLQSTVYICVAKAFILQGNLGFALQCAQHGSSVAPHSDLSGLQQKLQQAEHVVTAVEREVSLQNYCDAYQKLEELTQLLPECTGCDWLRSKRGQLAKDSGNEHYRRRDWRAANTAYTEALEHTADAELLAVIHANRAAAHKEMGQLKEAIVDCCVALHYKPLYAKAMQRRAQCLRALGDFEDAMEDIRGLASLPGAPNLSSELRELRLAQESQKDPHGILGVARSAGTADAKQAYHRLLLQWHPDKCSHPIPSVQRQITAIAAKVFTLIGEAYENLTKRKLPPNLSGSPRSTFNGAPYYWK
eukprot:TRINITY_DN55273_c0_g1_i1.p1 TRINITY_DN55273_c0_g1~~TRINITY_DN55273_c0_g1_i1.p1  ORF type:complete len:487 (+),score=71.70 TRINITY_DN55273_c0_g1_i1:36-1496(+)